MIEFSESLLEEWTDGKLVIQTIQVFCNGEPDEGKKCRLFLYGHEYRDSETKEIRNIHGVFDGPRGENRNFSLQELDIILRMWLRSIPGNLKEDVSILELIQNLYQGAYIQSVYFCPNKPMRYQILCESRNLIPIYKFLHKPISNQAKSLSKGPEISQEVMEKF